MAAVTSNERIPGPPPARFFGWRGNMIRLFRDPVTYVREAHQNYGNVVAFTEGGNSNMIATVKGCKGSFFAFGPACNQAILTQPMVFQSIPMATMELGHAPTTRLLSGIFSMNGEKHRQQRRLMMPAFHKKRIETYRDDMVAITKRNLDSWQVGTERRLYDDFINFTLEIACKILFGIDVQDSEHNLGRMIEKWIVMNMNPAIKLKLDWPGMPYRRFVRAGEELDNELHRLVEEKRASPTEQPDVLSMLIQTRDENGEQMTEDELIGQANIMFFAAHETTATVLTWTHFLIASHPEIYAALLEELDSVLHGEAPTVDQLAQLPLLDRVVKESMRLISPIPYLLRVAMEDTELEGHFIPAASEIFFSPYITHHMPHLYPDPKRFNPDRWLTIDPSPYEYIPFGAGVRMCIGAGFAMMEIKIVLAMLLQRYHLPMPAEVEMNYTCRVTTIPSNGLPVTVTLQDKSVKHTASRIHGAIRAIVDLPE